MTYVGFDSHETGNKAGSAITDTVFCGYYKVTHSVYPYKGWFLMWQMSGQLRALAVQGSVSGAYNIKFLPFPAVKCTIHYDKCRHVTNFLSNIFEKQI